MNVLVINQFASAPAYNTGAGERHYYLASHLSEKGYNFTIISGGVNHLFIKKPETKKLFNEEIIRGGRFIWVRLKEYNPESFVGRTFSWFEFLFKLFLLPIRKTNSPDIVIVSSMSLWPVIYAALIRRRYHIPLVLEIRDIWPLTPIEVGGFSKNNPFIILFRLLERYAYHKADSIIAVMSGFKEHLKSVIKEAKPVYWIPNAIESGLNNEAPDNIEPIHENPKFIIAYTGAIGFSNAMEYFIKAAELLKSFPNIEFLIVGDGPAKSSLKEMARELPNVIFKNKIPKSDIAKLLKQVDAGFISWKNIRIYNYGVSANKYNDYMLAGIPIISASNLAVDPVVAGNCGIQVPAEDERNIAEAILKLYFMDPVERKRIGKNGYNYVIAHNTYFEIAKQYSECIEDTKQKFKNRPGFA